MAGSPVEDGNVAQVPDLSLSSDFSNLAVYQSLAGGVGTTYDCDNTASTSFVSSSGILTPVSSNSPVSCDTPFATTDTRAPETLASDQDSDSSDTGGPKEYRCEYPGCKSKKKVFALKCQLRKHQNNHTRPWKCTYCKSFKGGAERKDLARHVRKAHPHEVRDDKTFWKEVARCGGCGKKMRADNLKRHLKTCGVLRASRL